MWNLIRQTNNRQNIQHDEKTVNHILAAGLLALLSLASCTDEFIEGNDLQGVDRDKRVEVRLPFGVGRGITTTITTRAAGGEIDYDSQLSGVMAFVYEAKSDNPEEMSCWPIICSPIRPISRWKALPADGLPIMTTLRAVKSSSMFRWAMCISICWAMRKVRSLISFREYRVGMRWALRRSF